MCFIHEMADNKENMGTITHQLSAVDDDLRKGGDVQEKTVASVALGMALPVYLIVINTNDGQPLL